MQIHEHRVVRVVSKDTVPLVDTVNVQRCHLLHVFGTSRFVCKG